MEALPDDVLAGALSFLDAASLVRASGVCRLWRGLLDALPTVWEGALFELDPCAVLGPEGVAAALGAGRSCLKLVHALGDSRCGTCRTRGAVLYAATPGQRACSCACLPEHAATAPLVNRFFFLRASEPGAVRVKSLKELTAAVAACNARSAADPASCYLNTVVVTRDIELGPEPLVLAGVKLCGAPARGRARGPRLTSLDCELAVHDAVIEDLELEVGQLEYDGDDGDDDPAAFPAIELHPINTTLIMRNCHVTCHVGSALMLSGAASASLHGCSFTTQSCFGVIFKTLDAQVTIRDERDGIESVDDDDDDDEPAAPLTMPFALGTLSVRGCEFTGSMWHVSVCSKLTPADVAALEESNRFDSSADENVEVAADKLSPLCSVTVQPWRPGGLVSALRAARKAAVAAAATAPAAAVLPPAELADAVAVEAHAASATSGGARGAGRAVKRLREGLLQPAASDAPPEGAHGGAGAGAASASATQEDAAADSVGGSRTGAKRARGGGPGA
jgi:hypothetical protein